MIYLLPIAALIVLCLDWLQTLQIARNPVRWFETNPVLGRHPSERRVHAWFGFVLAAYLASAFGLYLWLGMGAMNDAGRIGFVLGGGDGLGHGIYATGPARLVVKSFQIE